MDISALKSTLKPYHKEIKELAKKIILGLKEQTQGLVKRNKRKPCLAVILVGSDPASQVYVSHKRRTCEIITLVKLRFFLMPRITQNFLALLGFYTW